ncbi:hypothetical protein B0H16DRAFT_1504834 [Mycena metata]|uniref:Uncharacterized protein n=1 Tax=Mycena metata TaxID=1033252 RepID=A0AAD7K328_9AGAR|nr:hypothetical protein B0H16DRAFT_1504834 [Mycena metata]
MHVTGADCWRQIDVCNSLLQPPCRSNLPFILREIATDSRRISTVGMSRELSYLLRHGPKNVGRSNGLVRLQPLVLLVPISVFNLRLGALVLFSTKFFKIKIKISCSCQLFAPKRSQYTSASGLQLLWGANKSPTTLWFFPPWRSALKSSPYFPALSSPLLLGSWTLIRTTRPPRETGTTKATGTAPTMDTATTGTASTMDMDTRMAAIRAEDTRTAGTSTKDTKTHRRLSWTFATRMSSAHATWALHHTRRRRPPRLC